MNRPRPAPALRALLAAAALGLAAHAAAEEPEPGLAGGAPPAAARPAPRTLPRPVEVTLPDGLRVVVVEHHRRPVLELALVLPTGTLADPAHTTGATQLALALASDYHELGPDDDPIGHEPSFRRMVVERGGQVSFVATPDASFISLSGYSGDAGEYLRLLGEALAYPRHGVRSFTNRRNRLLDALEDLETGDPEALGQALQAAAFGRGSPYARPAHGTAADLERLGLEDVLALQERLLSPRGATLVVVGDVEPGKLLAEARKAFRGWTAEGQPPPAWTGGAGQAPAGVGYLQRQPASTLLVCAARPLAGARASDAELEVLAALLGRGVRSRLMLSLREEAGLAYAAGAELLRRRHARAFLACSPVAGAQAAEGVRRFRQVLDSLLRAPPGDEELERARALALAERDARLEEAGGVLEAWVEALRLGQPAPALERERAALARVGAAEVQRAAREVFGAGPALWILSGERAAAEEAARANRLGALQALRAQ